MSKILFSVSIAALALGMSAPTFAQEFTLGGTAVPADQVERLQARCDEAFAAEPAGASGGIGAGTEQDTKTGTETTPENDDDTDVDFATLDLATVDAEACRVGGFTPSAAN